MPRGNLLCGDGGVYHVTHRCHNRAFLLKFARDRDAYRSKLRQRLGQFKVSMLDYCLTSRHSAPTADALLPAGLAKHPASCLEPRAMHDPWAMRRHTVRFFHEQGRPPFLRNTFCDIAFPVGIKPSVAALCPLSAPVFAPMLHAWSSRLSVPSRRSTSPSSTTVGFAKSFKISSAGERIFRRAEPADDPRGRPLIGSGAISNDGVSSDLRSTAEERGTNNGVTKTARITRIPRMFTHRGNSSTASPRLTSRPPYTHLPLAPVLTPANLSSCGSLTRTNILIDTSSCWRSSFTGSA
jgi:hypothetical protein